ncbi:uracil-DNA glycosylase [bacterium]|nr:uracil-DNA glycosylase [bacterium]
MNSKLEKSWVKILQKELNSNYFSDIKSKVKQEYLEYTVYPPLELVFNALNQTPFNKTNVVILGQDPYHGTDQAHGLSFSVQKGINPPPSLVNIYKEIESDLGLSINKKSGDLTAWSKQGVLLLNSVLTVRQKSPGSHKFIGWEQFTDEIIKTISNKKLNVVFLLWGKYAQKKLGLINQTKHLVLTAPHPSPYSAHSGFFGCKHFSKTNTYLKSKNIKEINWVP